MPKPKNQKREEAIQRTEKFLNDVLLPTARQQANVYGKESGQLNASIEQKKRHIRETEFNYRKNSTSKQRKKKGEVVTNTDPAVFERDSEFSQGFLEELRGQ